MRCGLRAIASAVIAGVGKRDVGWMVHIPGVLGEPRLPRGGLGGERRKRWAIHGIVLDNSVSRCRFLHSVLARRRIL